MISLLFLILVGFCFYKGYTILQAVNGVNEYIIKYGYFGYILVVVLCPCIGVLHYLTKLQEFHKSNEEKTKK